MHIELYQLVQSLNQLVHNKSISLNYVGHLKYLGDAHIQDSVCEWFINDGHSGIHLHPGQESRFCHKKTTMAVTMIARDYNNDNNWGKLFLFLVFVVVNKYNSF